MIDLRYDSREGWLGSIMVRTSNFDTRSGHYQASLTEACHTDVAASELTLCRSIQSAPPCCHQAKTDCAHPPDLHWSTSSVTSVFGRTPNAGLKSMRMVVNAYQVPTAGKLFTPMCLCHYSSQYNLLSGKWRQCSAAGKVTVVLASHRP